MTREDLFYEIELIIESMYDDELKDVWNQYCDEISSYEKIYDMQSDFDMMTSSCTNIELVRRLDSDFNGYDDYFYFDGYDNIKSARYVKDAICDYDGLINYIIDYQEDFDNLDISSLFDEYDEEEEE